MLLNDTDGMIYVGTASGNAWIEMTNNGDIHVYNKGSLNIHSEGNFNVHAGGNINMEATGGNQCKSQWVLAVLKYKQTQAESICTVN